tara:strand:- start:8657 stop:9958 length:1302 start_codon:yes stop_codon:yes gene_type:complete
MYDVIPYLVLFSWPLIAILAYLKLDTVTATFVTIVGGYFILPLKVELDLPLLPPLDKESIPNISALISILILKKKKFHFFTQYRWLKVVIGIVVAIPFINVFFNLSPIFNGAFWLPSLTPHDGFSNSLLAYLRILPFIIAINITQSNKDVFRLFQLLVWSLLMYAPLVLLELRLSPQLHNWVYGYHPHSFIQQVRDGGFRAVVFLGHGLLTSNIYLAGFIALSILYKAKVFFINQRVNLALLFLFFVFIILLKSVSAIIMALLCATMVFTLRNSLRFKASTIIVSFVVLYPYISYLGFIPYEIINDYLIRFNAERAQSLYFRFSNEAFLLDYLGNNFLIGNGGSRMMLYKTVVDGTWIIWTMSFGVIYTTLNFLLFAGVTYINRYKGSERMRLNSLFALFPAIMMIDQIPNSSLTHPWMWLFGGAILIASLKK